MIDDNDDNDAEDIDFPDTLKEILGAPFMATPDLDPNLPHPLLFYNNGLELEWVHPSL